MKGSRRWRRRTFKRLFPWTVLGILALALALRLPFVATRSLWFDEAFSWRLSALFPSVEFFSRAAADVHPLLYYALLGVWMLPARGAGPEGSLLWMRLFSVLLGVATVAAMVVAGRVLFRSRWVAGAAGLLAAVNALHVQYAWEARMYMLGTALLPLAMAALVRVVGARSPRRAWNAGLGFGLSLGALLHVHYYALFSWAALGGAKLLYFLRQGVFRSSNFRAAEAGFWLSALLFLPWVPVFLAQVRRADAAFPIFRFDAWSVPDTVARLFWGGFLPVPHGWAVFASGAALALITLALARGRSFGDVVAVACFVIPVAGGALVALRTSVFFDRYFLLASVGLLLLLARGLSFLPSKVRMHALVFVAALGVLSILRFWTTLDLTGHQGVRAAASALRANAEPGATVVVSSPFVYFPLSFHLGCNPLGGACQGGLNVRLYSAAGEIVYFAGGPVLFHGNLVGPEVFSSRTTRLWVVDTTGFNERPLTPPLSYTQVHTKRFPEVFPYQGDIIVQEYTRH